MQKVKIGLIQGGFRSAFDEKIPELRKHNEYYDMLDYDDFQYNHGTLLQQILAAAEEGAELILTPESYLDGWSCNPAILEKIATTIDGTYVKELQETAALLNVWIEFHNSKSSIWNQIQKAITKAGFIVGNVSVLDKKVDTFNQMNATGSVKNDLIISAYKPIESFNNQFLELGYPLDSRIYHIMYSMINADFHECLSLL